MSSLVAVRALRNSINNGNGAWRSFASTSNVNKQTKQSSNTSSSVDSKAMDPPQSVFKQAETKELGPGASKQSDYKNPEYFLYHQMSYAEMEVVMAKLRVPQPSAKSK